MYKKVQDRELRLLRNYIKNSDLFKGNRKKLYSMIIKFKTK